MKTFEYAQKSVSLGVKNYILKPIGAESLYKKMVQICEKLHIENKQRQYVFSMKATSTEYAGAAGTGH